MPSILSIFMKLSLVSFQAVLKKRTAVQIMSRIDSLKHENSEFKQTKKQIQNQSLAICCSEFLIWISTFWCSGKISKGISSVTLAIWSPNFLKPYEANFQNQVGFQENLINIYRLWCLRRSWFLLNFMYSDEGTLILWDEWLRQIINFQTIVIRPSHRKMGKLERKTCQV